MHILGWALFIGGFALMGVGLLKEILHKNDYDECYHDKLISSNFTLDMCGGKVVMETTDEWTMAGIDKQCEKCPYYISREEK